MSPGRFVLVLAAVMVAIAIVDYVLGPRAEYLNGYEILRRTFGLPWAKAADTFIVCQERISAAWVLPWAWLLWVAEAAVVTLGLFGLARLVDRIL